MARIDLARLKRLRGNRRRVIKLPVIKVKLKERRELEAIAAEIVRFVYSYRDDFIRAYGNPEVTTDAAPEDIDRIISIILTQTNAVMARLKLRVRGWADKTEKRHRREFAAGVLSATSVNLETALDPNDVRVTVASVVNRSVDLIRDVGDEARKRIADAVYAGVTRRTPPREVAKSIIAAQEMSMRRAINIAADQAQKLNAALDRARQEEVGIPGFTWRHSGKVHAREEHLERDGEYYPWDDPPEDLPGELPFCGCSAQATLIDDADASVEAELEDA